MTSQGSPLTVLRRAIRSGSLPAVDMVLLEVPQLDLRDALEIIGLMAAQGDPRLAKWAERWADRVSSEEQGQLRRLVLQLPDAAVLEQLRGRALVASRSALSARLMPPV